MLTAQIKNTLDIAPWFPCATCNQPLNNKQLYRNYFQNLPQECGHTIDNLFELIKKALNDQSVIKNICPYSVIGLPALVFVAKLCTSSVSELDLEKFLPVSADILDILYTPNSNGDGYSFFPIEVHGNRPLRRIIPKKIYLYPRIIRHSNSKSSPLPFYNCDMHVTYWDNFNNKETDSYIVECLIDALSSFLACKYKKTIIPLHNAVEIKLKEIAGDIAQYSKKLDFRPALDIVLLYSANIKINKPKDSILNWLINLNKQRNKLIHQGKTANNKITKSHIDSLFAAAILFLEYLKFLESYIDKK